MGSAPKKYTKVQKTGGRRKLTCSVIPTDSPEHSAAGIDSQAVPHWECEADSPSLAQALATVYPLGGHIIQREAAFCSGGLISGWDTVVCPQRLTFIAAGGKAHWLE